MDILYNFSFLNVDLLISVYPGVVNLLSTEFMLSQEFPLALSAICLFRGK